MSRKKTQLSNVFDVPQTVLDLDSLPLSVKHFLLEYTNCNQLLKTFRLVSRSWNEISCRILRKVSTVPLSEEDEQALEEFKEVLLDRHISFPSGWPSPFETFKILEASFTTPSLVRFIQRPGLKITTLDVIQREDEFDLHMFETILERQKETITHLNVTSSKLESAPFLKLSDNLGTGWRSLKSIKLKDSCRVLRPCYHMDFVAALAVKVSIQNITLEGTLPNTVSIFTQNNQCWGSLAQLHLQWDKPPTDVSPEELCGLMRWSQEIQFPSLTSLTVRFSAEENAARTSEEYAPHILPIIQESSQHLKHLSVPFLPLSLLPAGCPKLTHLGCKFGVGDHIQDISKLRFPCLSSIYIHLSWIQVPSYVEPSEVEKHEKVTDVTVSWGDDSSEVALFTALPSLRDHFPNLNKIWIQPNITFVDLTLIRKNLPNLEDLKMSWITSHQLLGTPTSSEAAAKGWHYRDVGGCPLLELPKLTHLTLGRSVVVTGEMLVCLGCLSKLKFLRFHWNSALKSTDITEHLGGIKEVVLVYEGKEHKKLIDAITKGKEGFKLEQFQESL